MVDRLSYREFKEEFLLTFALLAKAETGKHIDPEHVASRIEQDFQKSWIMAAVKELSDAGLINGKMFISEGGSFALTGSGLDQAEEIANERAADLYELIDEEARNFSIGETNQEFVIGEAAASRVIQIDHLSDAFKSLDKELRQRIEELRADNLLMVEGGAEASQRLAELEAGKRLLDAEQVDTGLLQRLLIQSLTWFGKMVRDEAAKEAISRVIKLALEFWS